MVHYAAFISRPPAMPRRTLLRLIGCATLGAIAACIAPAPADAAADPNKVVRWFFPTGENGFDPVRISDLYSATILEAIFERLLTYDYLARPSKVVPQAAEAMPVIADEGK